jgi:hypothetical protein
MLIERSIVVFYETIHRRAGSSGAIMLGAFVASRHARMTFGTGRFSVHDFLRRGHGVVVQNNRGQAPCV